MYLSVCLFLLVHFFCELNMFIRLRLTIHRGHIDLRRIFYAHNFDVQRDYNCLAVCMMPTVAS